MVTVHVTERRWGATNPTIMVYRENLVKSDDTRLTHDGLTLTAPLR